MTGRQFTLTRALVVVVFTLPLSAQSVFTIAGGGPLGDGFAATNAILNSPLDVTFDSNGNMYVADTANHRVRKVDAVTGIITTIAGGGTSGRGDGGPATLAEVREPSGVAVDSDGNVFIAQIAFGLVRRVDFETRIITTVAGGGEETGSGVPALEAYLGFLQALHFDLEGRLLMTDFEGRLMRMDLETEILEILAGTSFVGEFSGEDGLAVDATLSPEGVAIEVNGDILVSANSRILRIAAETGILTRIAGDRR